MQEKSQSAVLRIKESLSYKLGSALIEYNQNGGGLSLFLKLITITKTYKRTQILYKDFISLYSHLKYPPIEQCSDYKEALKYKFHLSYLLGQALIKANKTWYKGGYIKLYSEIKKAKQTYKEFKALDEEHILETHQLVLIFEDKDKLKLFKEHKEEFKTSLKDLLEVFDETQKEKILNILFSYSSLKDLFIFFKDFKTLLNDFNNYEALSTSLKQALTYDLIFFTQNFNTIKEWLYSKEFKQNYQDKNHPYPSLLNPNKIDYESIPAELAWEMNLPLPRNYRFIVVTSSFSAHAAFVEMLEACGVSTSHHHKEINPKWHYFKNYELLLSKDFVAINCILYTNHSKPNSILSLERFLLKLDKKVPIICLIRDPITRFKSALNNSWVKFEYWGYRSIFEQNTILYPFLMKRIHFWLCDNQASFKDKFNLALSVGLYQINNALTFFKNQNFNEIIFIDAKDLDIQNALNTLQNLSKKFNFTKIDCDNSIFKFQKVERQFWNIFKFPITYKINDKMRIFIHYGLNNTLISINELFDIDLDFFEGKIFLQSDKETFETLKNSTYLLTQTKEKLQEFFDTSMKIIKETKYDENFVLNELSKDKELRMILKNTLDKEFSIVEELHPDIVASWKYYQEFKSMCEEFNS